MRTMTLRRRGTWPFCRNSWSRCVVSGRSTGYLREGESQFTASVQMLILRRRLPPSSRLWNGWRAFETEPGTGAGAHAVLAGGAELFLPLDGVIDLDRERTRLTAEITRLQGQATGTAKKLENENFVSRAPDDVVQKERDKLAQFQEQASKLREKLTELEGGAS